jgi:hypothetical protein
MQQAAENRSKQQQAAASRSKPQQAAAVKSACSIPVPCFTMSK